MENRIQAITGYTKAEIKAKYNTTPLKFYQARKAMKAMEAIMQPATQQEKEESWREDCYEAE